MQLSNLDIDIGTVAEGAAAALFQDGLEKIIRNIDDYSRPWKEKRKLTLTFEFSSNEKRDAVAVNVKQTLKLADPKATETLLYIAVGADGTVSGSEAARPAQMTIEPEQPTIISMERKK